MGAGGRQAQICYSVLQAMASMSMIRRRARPRQALSLSPRATCRRACRAGRRGSCGLGGRASAPTWSCVWLCVGRGWCVSVLSWCVSLGLSAGGGLPPDLYVYYIMGVEPRQARNCNKMLQAALGSPLGGRRGGGRHSLRGARGKDGQGRRPLVGLGRRARRRAGGGRQAAFHVERTFHMKPWRLTFHDVSRAGVSRAGVSRADVSHEARFM